jgi:hypothetical protein
VRTAKIEIDADGFLSGATVTTSRAEGWTFRVDVSGSSLTVTAPEGEQLEAEAIRALPLGVVLSTAQEEFNRHRLSRMDRDLMKLASQAKGTRAQKVAHMYRLALSLDVSPAAAIAVAFDRSPASAQRWIAEARAAGLLGTAAQEREQHGWPTAVRKRMRERVPFTPVKPPTTEDLQQLWELLNSPERRKATGRSPGPGSTQQRKDDK